MKKTFIILAIIILILCINKNEQIIIPKDSIRFRIIANSNNIEDQSLKRKIVNSLEEEISDIESSNDINEARKKINNNIVKIEEKINKELEESNYNKNITIKYGNNYFPQKEYKGIKYEEGKYESLVITIGEGVGDNFWCVLFPPLCKIDTNNKNVEYTSLVKEIINKYTNKS